MAEFVNGFFEERLQALIELAGWVDNVFSAAGIEYCVAGGLATYYYVEEVEPDAGRLTKDIDIVVRREDLDKICEVTEPFGFRYSQTDGVAMLLRGSEPARRGIHLIFANHELSKLVRRIRGVRLMPLADLIRMKLTSYRAKDAAHIVDLDEAGLITPDIEATLTPLLRERLAEARARG